MSKIGQVLTSIEVSQMVGKDHSKLLRDIRNYVSQLGEAKIGLSDFFTESTYITEQNKTMPCYLVTKKGCEFIAHKLTGQKGTEFTARYINRFHEMEDELTIINPSDISLGELASYLKIMDKVAVRQNLAPHKIAENFKKVSAQFGVELTEDFVNEPKYEQLTLESLGK
ncbi:MAG: Rha family transcriptional regulator [Lachnospiraceae bacterium]|nr:Rha family transcriptional regulator [Lachnospiraceae bacterium]